jgi:tRNA A-37 threonylcarbamoyl transferase component Bud32
MESIELDVRLARRSGKLAGMTFEAFFKTSGGQIVAAHELRNATQLVFCGMASFLKREYRVRWRDYLASWWAGWGWVSKSRREWKTLEELRKRGIRCPRAVAVGEQGGRAFLLVRAMPGCQDLPSYLAAGKADRKKRRRCLAEALGRAIARLHNAGFTHPDLYAKHVFIGPGQTVSFVDFQRTRLCRCVSWSRRWRDLAALDASLSSEMVSARDRFHFLATYLQDSHGCNRKGLWRRALWGITRRSQHLQRQRRVQNMRRVLPPGHREDEILCFRRAFDDNETSTDADRGIVFSSRGKEAS